MRKKRCVTPTEFGKEMRKLRIDLGDTMKDVCKRIGVTQAFISHVENGKCQVPDGFEEKVIAVYNLSGQKADALRKSAVISKNIYKIHAKTTSQKVLSHLLSYHIDKLDEEDVLGIIEFVEECLKNRELTQSKDSDIQQ